MKRVALYKKKEWSVIIVDTDFNSPVGGIVEYKKFIAIGGLLNAVDIKDVLSLLPSVFTKKQLTKPIRIKNIPSFYLSRAKDSTGDKIQEYDLYENLCEKFKDSRCPDWIDSRYNRQTSTTTLKTTNNHQNIGAYYLG